MTGRQAAGALILTALIVSTGCGDDIEPGTASALRSADGTVVWERPTQPSPVELLTDGQWVVILGFSGCDNSGQLSVLDAATGDEQWSMATVGGFGQRQVALAGDVVVNASDAVVTALHVDDGTELWSRKDLPGNLLVNGVAGTTVIGVHDHDRTPASSRLLAVDATTGTTRWETPLDGLGQIVDIVVVGELVMARLSGTAPDDAGRTSVVAVALVDGSIRWQREVGASEIAEPLMVAGDHAVVGLRTYGFLTTDESDNLVDEMAASASIVVLDTATGDERHRQHEHADDPRRVPSTPIRLARTEIFVGTSSATPPLDGDDRIDEPLTLDRGIDTFSGRGGSGGS